MVFSHLLSLLLNITSSEKLTLKLSKVNSYYLVIFFLISITVCYSFAYSLLSFLAPAELVATAKSRTRLSDFTFTFHFHALEKEMATHSMFLPGESQGWGSLVGFHLWGRIELDTTEVT